MSKKKAKEDWLDKKLKEVLEKYDLNPKDGVQMLIKASTVIPAYHKLNDNTQ